MKKLLVVVATGVAGFMGANNLENPQEKITAKVSGGGYYNVAVATTCGAPYSQKVWFDAAPTTEDLQNIATAKNIALCDEEGGSATAVKAKKQITQ